MKTTYKKIKKAAKKAYKSSIRQKIKRGIENPSLLWKRNKILN